jgi:hypothetical protein
MKPLSLLSLLFCVAVSAEEPKGTVVKLDKFASVAPADWKSEKPRNRLRSHQFKLPGIKDAKPAEVYIFPDLTKTPEENFARYEEMLQLPEGKKVEDFAKRRQFALGEKDKVKVFVLDMKGTILYRERPFDPKSKVETFADYRMISLIFESPDGNYLIRLWGPEKTVNGHEKAFMDWVKAFKVTK